MKDKTSNDWKILLIILTITLLAIILVQGLESAPAYEVYMPLVRTEHRFDCGPFDIYKPWPPCWIDFDWDTGEPLP